MGAWTGVERGLSALNTTFDALSERERLDRLDALNEPYLRARSEEATLDVADKRRKSLRLQDYDSARTAGEVAMEMEQVPGVEKVPNPGYRPATPERLNSQLTYAGEANEMVPASPAVGMPAVERPTSRPLTEQEKNQRRISLALKYGQTDEITKIGTLVDVSNKVGMQGADAMVKWAKSVTEFRKQFGAEAAKVYGTQLGQQLGIKTDGMDFSESGDILRMAPNGNWFITKDDGSVHEFKPNSDSVAHNTIKEHSPDGTMERVMQYNPDTRRFDIPATGWSKISKAVPSAHISINQPTLSDGEIDHYAEMYNKYGRTALPFSLRNMPPKLAARAAELARGGGKSGPDVGFDIAQTGADKKSYDAITKGMDTVVMFKRGVTDSLALLEKISDKMTRTPIPGINKLSQYITYNAGDPDVKMFKNFVMSTMNEYMKVSTAGLGISVAELTQGAQQRAQALLEISDNPETFRRSISLMKQDMEIAERRMTAQRKTIEDRMKKGTGKTAAPTGKKFKVDAAGNVTEVE